MTLSNFIPQFQGADDVPKVVSRPDISGGVNTRQDKGLIAENQIALLYNVDIGVQGEAKKRPGLTLVEDLGSDAGTGALGFEPDGGSNELLVTHGAKLEGWTGSGTFTEHKTDFTSGLLTTMVKVGESGEGDVVLVSNGTDNVFRMNQSHTFQDLGDANTSPPLTTVMAYYRNRAWSLKSNLLYFSDAYPADYSAAFDRTTNAFRMPVGTERAIVGLRDLGLIILGADQVWAINPSPVPDPSLDNPEKILDIGCAAGNTACQVGDDVFFLANDGVRGVFRTAQDKVQLRQSFPLSHALKDNFDTINWAYISKACAVYFDNKYFISLPTSEATYNNSVWVYYPALNAWTVITGWYVAAWTKLKIDGEERLYCIHSNADGKVYRAWYGYSDNSTAINYQEEGREENFGNPYSSKLGSEVILKAKATGDYDLSIYVSLDDADFQLLGTMNLLGNVPALPEDLPFLLVNPNLIIKKFHIDNLGEWKTLQLKIQHNATNGSDDIIVYERIVLAYPLPYIEEV